MGVGSSRRLSSVRWKGAGNIVAAGVMTLPASATLAMPAHWVMTRCGYQ